MSYIDKNLLPDEKILFRTRKHFMVFFFPAAWVLFSVYAVTFMQSNPILIKLDWVPWLIALLLWSQVALDWVSSEFAVTNKRVMMREGFFTRHTNEMRISAISQVNVDQSLIGQMLNYGTVSINAFGAYDAFSMVAHPFTFQKYVNEQLDKLTR
jgi:uncharacterized membrane protein YdbT with pleckstrin-like domain